jgi:4-alpha-glucanotransferase
MNLASNSKVAIQSMNDILLQDSSSRINTPSSIANNWTYRITEEDLSNDLIKNLKALNARYGRLKPDTD